MITQFIQQISSLPFFASAWFGIIAMVVVGSSWCLVGIVMGDAPKRGIEPSLVQLFGLSCSITIGTVLLLTTGVGINGCSLRVAMMCFAVYATAGCMNFIMLQIMSYAMQRGPNGIIWSIIQSALVFPFIVSVIFFDVRLTLPRGSGLFLLLAALVMFGLLKNNTKKDQAGSGRLGWKTAAFICLGICAVQQNLTTMPSYFDEARKISSIARALSVACGGWFGAVCYNIIRSNPTRRAQFRKNVRNPILWIYIGCLQFFNLIFAYTLFYPGMNAMALAGLGGMCYPVLVGSCIVAFSLVGIFWLREKVGLLHFAALACCISGLVLLCFPAR